jgi:hypothetical protein
VKTKSDKSNILTVAQCRLACTQLPIADVWRVPHRLNLNIEQIPTRDNITTIKDQYETKLVQFLSLTTKICVPAEDHRVENSSHIRGLIIIRKILSKNNSLPRQ